MKLWHLFFNREVNAHEAFKPTDESRECCAADQFASRLEAVRKVDAVLDATCAQLASHEEKARATARVFLMPLKFDRLTESVAYLAVRGWRMKFRGKHVEMVRP